MSMTIMMDFRTWQLSKGLVMLPEIRDVRGAFTRLLHKLRGKERYPSKKKNKTESYSVTKQRDQWSEKYNLTL